MLQHQVPLESLGQGALREGHQPRDLQENARRAGPGERLFVVGAREERPTYRTALATRADGHRAKGQTVVYLAVEGVVVAALGVADLIKPTTAKASRSLHAMELQLNMTFDV